MEYKYKLDYAEIIQRIKKARKTAHITQAELAERIDISTNAVAKLESNLMKPSLQTLINIANELSIDINFLLMDPSSMHAEKTNVDLFLESLLTKMSQKDKEFIIYIINGLKIYQGALTYEEAPNTV